MVPLRLGAVPKLRQQEMVSTDLILQLLVLMRCVSVQAGPQNGDRASPALNRCPMSNRINSKSQAADDCHVAGREFLYEVAGLQESGGAGFPGANNGDAGTGLKQLATASEVQSFRSSFPGDRI